MYTVDDLYKNHAKKLGLELIAGKDGVKREIKAPEAHRPGLALTGYLKNNVAKRIIIFGKVEMEYLKDLEPAVRLERLESLLGDFTPAVILARRYKPSNELLALCETKKLPLIRTSMITMNLLSKLTMLLKEDFAKAITCHGTLVEVFGVGVLITGDSSVGKSEAALGLIERGHRLISDDVVRVKKREGSYLEGSGAEVTKHHMEIRGIGIINVAHLYGAVCVRDSKSIDLVVRLEQWNDNHFYDRVGLDDHTINMLGIKVPFHTLPVKPGRDVVLLLETIALNHRLRGMGYNSAKEFNGKLLEKLLGKSKKRMKLNETRF